MVYLTGLSLKYAIDMCLEKPGFEATIVILEDDNNSAKKAFDFLVININKRGIAVGKQYIKKEGGMITFFNSSRIRVIFSSTTERYIRCHLLIIDNRINGDTMRTLRAFEIRNYNSEKFNKETKGEQLMNIVQVNFINSITQKRYTYKVSNGISLNKGDIIRVRNKDGKEAIAVCVTDSENLSDNAVDMVMGGLDVLSDVVGVYNLVKFQEMTNE